MNDRERSKLAYICASVAADPEGGMKTMQFVRSARISGMLLPNSAEFERALDAIERALKGNGKHLKREAQILIKSDDRAEQDAGRSLLWHISNVSHKRRRE